MELKNKRHQLFVQEYLSNGRNALQSYLKVYGCDAATAQTNGSKLLTNTLIQAAIAEEDTKLTKKFDITREYIAEKLIEVVNDSDIAGDRKNKISALNSLTKLFGHDAPVKAQVEHLGIIINYQKPE